MLNLTVEITLDKTQIHIHLTQTFFGLKFQYIKIKNVAEIDLKI